jgi:ketosteroid isomerase-like protein
MSGLEVVKRYWSLMQSNDFRSVGQVLSDDFVLEWPQSNERIRGRDNLASMNEEYPAHGIWRFTINKILGDEIDVVSDVSLTDGVQVARVISFFTVTDGKIRKMVEFWPDPFTAPDNRRHLVELMED